MQLCRGTLYRQESAQGYTCIGVHSYVMEAMFRVEGYTLCTKGTLFLLVKVPYERDYCKRCHSSRHSSCRLYFITTTRSAKEKTCQSLIRTMETAPSSSAQQFNTLPSKTIYMYLYCLAVTSLVSCCQKEECIPT